MLAVVNLVATAFMAGVIWFVQVVHYPLFARVGREGFASYETAHARLTTLVVGPAMLIEAISAALLLLFPPRGAPGWAPWVGIGLVAVAWLSTALLAVPQHALLQAGFDERAHSTLVWTNWVRTAAWSARAALMGWVVVRAGPG